ncbi:MAG: hypothetical protein A2383_01345 [Candidatus Pacebacteria bacterium RIFOXYB1_FULL_39_46]|nr:MAG: hypothetical protein A2383_01345 [Candidatus Pacebacteria bacterium RIFOXYB1_FULL_39_46]OGJ39036.1 MAG: hypothetical protein A2182_01765 [Candidatus Pacebacteria bacterium RIFOXYA1_FULL_38_18]OGJ40007.1 MAG: hypothetical protein A2582_01290 [Candidatus Pacebacteria bacterium RIFOXYD1_FULL_39_27]OGJ40731.1 MAG: hypothetical protein A2411_00405 [Candidatus Pacebacteria bacterium RIFOXYC1_FULL_39_21]
MKNISKLSDEKVVEIVRTDNKEIYAEIIKRYQTKLMRYALYLINDEHQAADVVQDSFIKAYVNLQSFDLKKKFSSWIYRIVHNEAMNLINKTKNNQAMSIKEFEAIDDGVDLEDSLIKKELILRAQNCLNQISLIYREPLSLYYLEEKSYEEISDILKIPIGTVGTRINRAKVIIKKICQKK